MLRLLYLSIIAFSTLSTCSRQYSCTNYYDYVFEFHTAPAADSIRDTMATVVDYLKNGAFSTPVDTFAALPFFYAIQSSQYSLPKGATDEFLYKYDRIITLYPSGRTYKMRNVTHNERSVKGADSDPVGCTNDIFFVVNDSQYHVPGMQQNGSGRYGGDAIMPIKY